MKFWTMAAVLMLGSATIDAWSKCNEDAIVYGRSTSIGLTLGSGSSTSFESGMTINIPLSINGKAACYKQKGQLSVQTKDIKEAESVEYEITPLTVEFSNVPEGKLYQYLHVNHDVEGRASKVSMISFVCSGETPIGGDAFSDSLKKIAGGNASFGIRTYFATGQAAEELARREKKAKLPAYETFMDLFVSRVSEIDEVIYHSTISIPAVISGQTMNSVTSVERQLYSNYFSRTGAEINGCSIQFRETMKDFLIENVVRTNPFAGINLKKKMFSKNYRMKWIL
ncbi:MAG: hypothetical protein ACLGHN_11435 [Bacteriovoracia bacterium]